MDRRTAVARPGARAVEADVCGQCGSLWLDGHELAEISPELGGLPHRMDEIRAFGVAGKGIPRCPRCGQVPLEIALLDVPIDICPDCAGVWLDGGEYDALARAADAEEGLAPRDAGAPVREAAWNAVKTQEAGCAVCAGRVKLEEAFYSDRGLVCAQCFHGSEQARLQQEASADHGETSAYFRQGAGLGADAGGGAKAVATGLLGVAALLVMAGNRCHACGRRRCHACSRC
jgi:Zn-finger nucleic acid-binding protein